MGRCHQGWLLFVDWCNTSFATRQVIRAEHPEFSEPEIRLTQEENEVYQKSISVYRKHLETCETCRDAIRQIAPLITV